MPYLPTAPAQHIAASRFGPPDSSLHEITATVQKHPGWYSDFWVLRVWDPLGGRKECGREQCNGNVHNLCGENFVAGRAAGHVPYE